MQVKEKPVYSIDTPPPYINSPVHMGHASTYAIMDFIASGSMKFIYSLFK